MRYVGLGLGGDRRGEKSQREGSFTQRVKPTLYLQAILVCVESELPTCPTQSYINVSGHIVVYYSPDPATSLFYFCIYCVCASNVFPSPMPMTGIEHIKDAHHLHMYTRANTKW